MATKRSYSQSEINKTAWSYARKLNNGNSKGCKKYLKTAMQYAYARHYACLKMATMFTVKQLLVLAKKLKIVGRWKMRKAELTEQIAMKVLSEQQKTAFTTKKSKKTKQYSFTHKI